MSRLPKMIGIVGLVCVLGLGNVDALAACPTFPTGFTCECNAADTEWVCAKWGAPGTPTHLLDFTVTYVWGVPNVTLSTADLGWELYSEVISTGAPADIGTLALDNSGTDDFEVTIANGAGAGGTNVWTINLDDAGFTGFSSIEGAHISGNLTGALTVVQDSGGLGGEVTLLVDGDVSGAMTIPVLKSLEIGGDLLANVNVTDKMDANFFVVHGDVGTTVAISVADLVAGNIVFELDLAGSLLVQSGFGTGATVHMSTLTSSGSVDLNGQALGGHLHIVLDSAGNIDVGSITGIGNIVVSGDATGSIDVGGDVTQNGSIQVQGLASGDITITGDLSGTVSVGGDLTGDVDIDGDLTSSGDVTVSGALGSLGRILVANNQECAGAIKIGEQTDSLTLIHCAGGLMSSGTIEINTSEGNFNAGGVIQVGVDPVVDTLPPVTYDGCIRIYDENPGNTGGDLDGTIKVAGCHATDDNLTMCIDGDLNGTIDIEQTGCPNQVRPVCYSGCP